MLNKIICDTCDSILAKKEVFYGSSVNEIGIAYYECPKCNFRIKLEMRNEIIQRLY